MMRPRQPGAFPLQPSTGAEPARQDEAKAAPAPAAAPAKPRRPQAVKADEAVVRPSEFDYFATPDPVLEPPPPAVAAPRRSWPMRIFLAAAGLLVTMAVGLWTDALIRSLFERADWLGWVAVALAAAAVAALLVIILRETIALRRLGSIERIREAAESAIRSNDAKAARAVVSEVSTLVAANPETAAGRRAMAALDGDIVDGANYVRVAEAELLGPLDAKARTLVLDAAKRVSVVTAVSPRALVDLSYVVFESARLVRRIAELYGARPGKLGFFRLARAVIAHLAVTGAIAAGDEAIQQVVGQGLAARISSRLGEGVVNGAMTARIGIAAIETVRPLPFTALPRPKLTDIVSALSAFSRRNTHDETKATKR